MCVCFQNKFSAATRRMKFETLPFIITAALLLWTSKGQFTDVCLLPTCTLTTTTTTDVLTIASVVNLTTTIIVSQALQLQCVNSTTTSTLLTSTCTLCTPTKKSIETCGFSNGGFVVAFKPRPFLDQVAACKSLDLEIAELSFENFPIAAEVARKCLGQQRMAYIKSYEGDAKPCLVLSTGEGMKHDPVFGANIEITCCSTRYPVICREREKPDNVCLPQCNAPQCINSSNN